jgi:IS4 transposase
LLKQIPWASFDRLVDEHGADARVRRLSTRSQLVALLYGQLAGAQSLREIEGAMQSHRARLYHLGAREVSRSTLADANAQRPHQVFSGLFAQMAGLAGRKFRQATAQTVRLIDSTGLHLAGAACGWARYSARVCGAKAHIILDPDADIPLYLEITPTRVNDITAAKAMPVEAGATYVFDMGYYDFGWWAQLDQSGCRIVTRLKSHTRLQVVEARTLPPGSALLFDRVGYLSQRLSYSRSNPFCDPVREIGVVLETGKILRVMTNDLDAPAQEIADLYRRRWEIELFFRFIKQTLKIRHFLGRSENAVRIQVAVALIAYLLIRLAREAVKTISGELAFSRLVKTNLMMKRGLDQLLKPHETEPIDTRQLCLSL